jgi:cytochrome c biogenesis protein CcmG, thiol:disulfide interchange protein DsbE
VKNQVNKVKFWTPLRLVCTVISFGLLIAFGVSSCNSNDPSSNPANRSSATPNRTGLAAVPQPILDAENPASNGAPIKLGDYSGKVLLVNLWATWCGPCRMETPELVKLNKEFRDRGVEMIGLSTEDPNASAQSVSNFVREYKVDYQIGWATPEVALGLMQGRTNIPQSFIITRDGRIMRRFIGFSPQSTPAQLKQALEQALVEKG